MREIPENLMVTKFAIPSTCRIVYHASFLYLTIRLIMNVIHWSEVEKTPFVDLLISFFTFCDIFVVDQ